MRSAAKLGIVRRAWTVAGIVLLTLGLIGAGDSPRTRFNDLGHRMMCTCGDCTYLLLECNHVGCPDSERMRKMLSAGIDSGQSDDQILKAFKEKFGPIVLAAPTAEGFDRVAWTMPGVVLLLGAIGAALVVRRWRLRLQPAAAPDVMPAGEPCRDPREDELRRRARQETEL